MTRMTVIWIAAAVMSAAFVVEAIVSRVRHLDYDFREMRTNLMIGAGFLVCAIGWSALTAGAYAGAWALTPLRFDMTSGWSWLVLFLARELCFYWSHRASHEVGWMWASHHVHHSSTRLTLGTAMRNSWVGGAVDWIFMLPLAFAGFDPLSITTMHMASSAWNFCAHCGSLPRLGLLDVVFVTPTNHRVHHGTRPDEPFHNYGAVLTVWDRMFGTFRPEPEGPLVFGVVPPPERPYDPVYLELAPWRTYLRGRFQRRRRAAAE
ncbi:MAG TPA: sterol desaturase family protein [Kofleriaceae bacterium]|nr:sterol desaturase family protein [Kofleriaceae bacterium]